MPEVRFQGLEGDLKKVSRVIARSEHTDPFAVARLPPRSLRVPLLRHDVAQGFEVFDVAVGFCYFADSTATRATNAETPSSGQCQHRDAVKADAAAGDGVGEDSPRVLFRTRLEGTRPDFGRSRR